MVAANPLQPSLSINAIVMKYIGFRLPPVAFIREPKNRYNFRINIISNAFRARRVKRSVSPTSERRSEHFKGRPSKVLHARCIPFRRTLTIYAIDFVVPAKSLHWLSSVRPLSYTAGSRTRIFSKTFFNFQEKSYTSHKRRSY